MFNHKTKIRVRIAPSPTGFLHIGTARSALFNYLFAKKNKGRFILRIEDTDIERSNPKFEKDIIESLKWLGIYWDEGPDKRGSFGPYRQSERIKTYIPYIKKLLNSGNAYHCFCTEEELNKEREEALRKKLPYKYSGKCKNLSKDEIKKRLNKGEKSIIRFKTPKEKLEFSDIIRGKIEFDCSLFEDVAIAKDLNTPLYNFAVVIDDYLMEITHVIRGEDHITNTPKQIMIQRALGIPRPKYAHLPLILNPDKTKLSKRTAPVSINNYKKEGYLPKAIINFIVLLGWNPKTEQEIFSMEQLIQEFDLMKIHKSGAIFDINRLNWINSHYIKKTNLDELTKLCIPYLKKNGFIQNMKFKPNRWETVENKKEMNFSKLKRIIALEKDRIKKLSEAGNNVRFFFKRNLEYNSSLLLWKKMTKQEAMNNLSTVRKELNLLNERDFTKEKLEAILMNLIKIKKTGVGEMLWPLRVALSGQKSSPNPFEIAEILEKEEVLYRIKQAEEKLTNKHSL